MPRKNWVVPGFLVLAILLLLSFPGVALAEDSGTVPAAGVETSAPVQTEQVSQGAGESGAQQGTDNVPALDDTEKNMASADSDSSVTAPENTQKEEAANDTAPEEPVSTDPVKGDDAAGEPEKQAPADTAKPAEEPAAEPDKQETPNSIKQEEDPVFGPEQQASADTAEVEEKPATGSEEQAPSDMSTVGEKPVAEPLENQSGINPAPVIVIPKDIVGEQDSSAGTVKPQAGQLTYVVQPGDTVKKISEKTGISVDKIKEANGLNVADSEVALPMTSSVSTDVPSVVEANNKDPGSSINYMVREGESLWLIGRNLGVPYQEIMAANNLTGHLIYPDQNLIVPGIKLEGNMFRYRIKKGDTFYYIARALGLKYDQIMSINGFNDIWIYPGQELVIPDMTKVTLYEVQEGETLSDIAGKFSVIKSMIYGHGISDGKLVEGQVLVIPQDAAVTEAANVQVNADAGVKLENASDLDLLARAIFAEARGEVHEGKVAVGAVILNRLNDPAFPKTIRDIIFQPRAFTAVDDGQINLTPDKEAYRAAREAMNGADPSMGAVYYWNPEIATSDWIWSRPIIKQIGNHVFAR